MQSIRFSAVYGIAIPGRQNYKLFDRPKLEEQLVASAKQQQIPMALDPDLKGHQSPLNLMAQYGHHQWNAPETRASPHFDSVQLVFTHQDATTFEQVKTKLRAFEQERGQKALPAEAIAKNCMEHAERSAQAVSRFSPFLGKMTFYLGLAGMKLRMLPYEWSMSSLEKTQKHQLNKSFGTFLKKLPKPEECLPIADVLQAMAQSKFDVANGKIKH